MERDKYEGERDREREGREKKEGERERVSKKHKILKCTENVSENLVIVINRHYPYFSFLLFIYVFIACVFL